MYPYQCWVIVEKDREGKPRGFEKSTGKLYFSEYEAKADLVNMGDIQASFMVAPIIAMGAAEYQSLVTPQGFPKESRKLIPCTNPNVKFSLTITRPDGRTVQVEQDHRIDADYQGNVEEGWILSQWAFEQVCDYYGIKAVYGSTEIK